MSVVGRISAQRRSWSVDALVPDRRLPAAGIVAVYYVLLLGLPSKLIIAQIGAAGTPANLWGLFALLWWTCATVGGHNPARTLSPMRLASAGLTVAVLLSYVAAMTRGWYVRQTFDSVPMTCTTSCRQRSIRSAP